MANWNKIFAYANRNSRGYRKRSSGVPGIPSSFNSLMSNKVYRKKPKWVDKYKKHDNALIDNFYDKHPGGYYH